MKTDMGEALERLVMEHRRKVAQIRADESLSWEKKELKIRELGIAFDRARKQLESEEEAA